MINKRITIMICAGSLIILWRPALVAAENVAGKAGGSVDLLFEDLVLARGKGVEVKKGQLTEAFASYKASLAARNQVIREEERAAREGQLLDRLIITQIVVNRATEGDKLAAKGLAEKYTADAKKANPSEEGFYRQLRAMGVSTDQFSKRVTEQALVEAVLDREVKSGIKISDADVEEFYKTGKDLLVKAAEGEIKRMEQNPDTTLGQLSEAKKQVEALIKANLLRMETPEKVRVSHILLATRTKETEQELPDDLKKKKRQQMEQLLQRTRGGEDFSKLIELYSEDRNVKGTRGEYTFSREDPFAPEFKAAAFSLQPNQVSDVITTIFGYHIIKLHERIPAKKIDSEKIKAEIKDHLIQQELQKRLPEYFEGLKKEAGVEILDAKYKVQSVKSVVSGQ